MKPARMKIAVWGAIAIAIGAVAVGVSLASRAADAPRADAAKGAASAPARPALTVSVDRPRRASLGIGLTANGSVALSPTSPGLAAVLARLARVTCPSFRFMFSEEKVMGQPPANALPVQAPEGKVIVPDRDALVLVDYLLALKRDDVIPASMSHSAPGKPAEAKPAAAAAAPKG